MTAAFNPGDVVVVSMSSGQEHVRGRLRCLAWKVDLDDGSTILVDETQMVPFIDNVVALRMRLSEPYFLANSDDGVA
jgi:hypothetical protein